MQNQLSNDKFVRALRDVETPSAPGDLVARLRETPSVSLQKPRWALSAAMATAFVTIAIGAIAFRPSYSLADVVKALAKQPDFTLHQTQSYPDHPDWSPANFTQYRSGDKWRVEQPAGYDLGMPDKTIMLRNFQGPISKYVTIEKPVQDPQADLDLRRLLSLGKVVSEDHNIDWNGKKVDVFRVEGSLPGVYGPGGSFVETVYVDPATKLPLELMLDLNYADVNAGKTKIVNDYDYSTPSPSLFDPAIPSGHTVYDASHLRDQLAQRAVDQPVGAVIVDEWRQVVLLVKESNPRDAVSWPGCTLIANGVGTMKNGTFVNQPDLHPIKTMAPAAVNFQWPTHSVKEMNTAGTLTIGGKTWHFAQFAPPDSNVAEPALMSMKTTSGSFTVLGKTVKFKDVPVIRTGNGLNLIRGYLTQ